MALEKEFIDDVGNKFKYHRIKEAIIDFNSNQIHIIIDEYVDKQYRDVEKKAKKDILDKTERYYELLDKKNKGTRSFEEEKEFTSINIQELEAVKVDNKSARSSKVTLDIDQDIRDMLYSRIINEVSMYNDSKEV